jgi:hypothetical protein
LTSFVEMSYSDDAKNTTSDYSDSIVPSIARATCIGDMPVLVCATDGSWHLLTFTNVRCVPGFKYTLLSVNQMWKEQNIDPLFADSRSIVDAQVRRGGPIRLHDGQSPADHQDGQRHSAARACARSRPAASTAFTALPAVASTPAAAQTPARARAGAAAPVPLTPSHSFAPSLPSVTGTASSPPPLPTPRTEPPASASRVDAIEAAATPQPPTTHAAPSITTARTGGPLVVAAPAPGHSAALEVDYSTLSDVLRATYSHLCCVSSRRRVPQTCVLAKRFHACGLLRHCWQDP